MPNFAEMAKQSVDELPEVKILPVGTYIWEVDEVPDVAQSAKGDHDVIKVVCRVVGMPENNEPDEEELNDFGNVVGEKLTMTFTVIREDADPNRYSPDDIPKMQARAVKQISTFFFDHLQLADEVETLEEAMSASVRRRFEGYVMHEPDNRDTERMMPRIRQTAPTDQ